LSETIASIEVPTIKRRKKLLQLLIEYESLFDGNLGDRKTKLVSFQLKEVNTTPWPSFPSAKNTQDTLIKKKLKGCVNWGY
jgi:hypothetical protein